MRFAVYKPHPTHLLPPSELGYAHVLGIQRCRPVRGAVIPVPSLVV